MKKLLTTLFAISSLFVFAQTPQGINYQSIIRNTGGTVMSLTPVTVEFKLYNGLAGVMLYHETHSTTTNPFGMANLIIGQGTVVGGTVSFNNIPWVVGVAYEVYVNSNLVGTKQLFMSVPYALHAASAANAPAPSITFSNNVLSVGGNTVSITTATPYVGGTGITVSGSTITNNAPDQTVSITGTGATTVSGTYPNFTIASPAVSTSVPPTIIGTGATSVTSSGNTYTVTSPVPVIYTAGNGIAISGVNVISNTATPVTPTITGIGAATVTSSGNSFTVDAPGQITPTITGTGATNVSGTYPNLTINTPTVAGDQTVTINAAGAATVTGSYPNFTVNVPSGTSLPTGFNGQFLYNNGTIWDTLPRNNLYFDGLNFGIGTTSPQADFHVNGAGKFNASVTTPQVYTDNIKITGGISGQILTSDASGNGTWQSPAAVSSTSLSAGNSNITLNQSGNAYTITPVTPTLSTVGNVSIGGAYPNQSITVNPQVLSVANNSVVSLSNGGGSVNLLPATLTYTPGTNTLKLTDGSASSSVVLNSTAATTVTQGANVTVTGSASSYTVSAPAYALSANSNTLTLSNGTAITTATVPVSTPPSITGTGVSSVTTVGNTYTVNTPMSTYNNTTGVFATGTQTISVVPTLSLTGNVLKSGPASNSVTIPTSSVVAGNANIIVTPSGNTYSVSAPAFSLTASSNTLTLSNGSAITTATVPNNTLSGGIINRVAKWGSATSLGNSNITDNGSTISMSPTSSLPGLVVNSNAVNAHGGNLSLQSSGTATTSGVGLGSVYFGALGGMYDEAGIRGERDAISSGGTDLPSALVFYTTTDGSQFNAERMRITNGGKMGLGTNAPAALLHLANTGSQFKIGNTNQPSYEWLWDVDATANLSVGNENNGTPLTHMFIHATSGNVGIGTTSPASKLHVVGTFKLNDGTEGAGKILISDASGNASWNTPPSGPWSRTSTTVTLTNPSDWVGIGTSTPNSPLQVAGYISFENNGSNTSLGSGAGGGTSPNNYYNTFVGASAGQQVSTGTGNSNSFLGYHAGQNTVNGFANTFMGTQAGAANNVGSSNSFFGSGAGQNNNTGINNVFVGAGTGANNTTAQNNTFLGNGADLSSTTQYTNATAIGYNTKVNNNDLVALGNNSDVIIGGSKAGIVSGATRYLTVANTTAYSPGTNTSLELQGYTNSGNASAARIDFINGLAPTAIARVEAITGGASTVQGALRFFTNGGTLTEAMRITPTGNVGIGTTTPGGLFELALDQGRKPSTSAWTVTSDERLKNIEGSYTKGLKEILLLNPIAYHYKNVGERKFEDEVTKTLSIGFSAQEVQKIFPEAVGVDADGYLNFNIHAILIAYTNAIKELNSKNEEQQKTIEQQKNAIENLEQKFEQRLKALEEVQKKTNK